jgi:hypothetical protein
VAEGHTALTSQFTGKAEDESAPEGKHRTALERRRDLANAECCPGRQAPFNAKRFYLFAGGGRKVWKECRRPLLLTRSVNTPVGRVALPVTPPPDDPRSYSITLLTHPLNQEIRASVGPPARTGGRPRGACGEGACDRCGRPPVRRTLAPPFGLVTGHFLPVMRGRRPAYLLVHRRCA